MSLFSICHIRRQRPDTLVGNRRIVIFGCGSASMKIPRLSPVSKTFEPWCLAELRPLHCERHRQFWFSSCREFPSLREIFEAPGVVDTKNPWIFIQRRTNESYLIRRNLDDPSVESRPPGSRAHHLHEYTVRFTESSVMTASSRITSLRSTGIPRVCGNRVSSECRYHSKSVEGPSRFAIKCSLVKD